MRSIEFEDFFSKMPASERLQQQGQQQPVVDQDINIRKDKEVADLRMDSPQENDPAAKNTAIEREKRDREFRRRERKRKEKQQETNKREKDKGSQIIDVEG